MAIHESFLAHERYRWLKLSAVLLVACLVPYVGWPPVGGNNGGTWLGYVLGMIGAFLIFWLMWLGVRKRSYGPGAFSLKGWLSAHVYLGVTLLIVASLHAGFEVGLNIHTLLYVLMILVIVSGLVGVIAYVKVPSIMTENRRGQTLQQMAAEIQEQDRQCANLALGLSDTIVKEVQQAKDRTRLGGGALRLLLASDRGCPTKRALARIRAMEAAPANRQRQAALVLALAHKSELLGRARRDMQLQAMLDAWLFFHVPLSFAVLVALVAHIVAVFFYWG